MKKITLFSMALVFALLPFQNITAQTWKWAVGSNCPNGAIESGLVAVDGSGNVYSTGDAGSLTLPWTSVKSYFGPDDSLTMGGSFIVSTDSNGNYRWVLSALYSSIFSIKIGPFGELYLFGYYNSLLTIGTHSISSPTHPSVFVAKLDTSGSVLWLKNVADSAYGVGTVDNYGNLCVAGYFNSLHMTIGATTLTNSGPPHTYDVFVCKLDSSGSALWAQSFGGDANDEVTSVSCAYNGDIFIGGFYYSSNFTIGPSLLTNSTGGTKTYLFVAKYNTYGYPIWGDSVATTNITVLNKINTDAWGNAYVTGLNLGNASFGPITLSDPSNPSFYLTKYRNNGVIDWVKSMHNSHYPQGYSVAPDACGNVWVAGGSYEPSFLFEYDTSGAFLDSVMLRCGGDDYNDIVVDNKGNLYMGGDYAVDYFIAGTDTLRLTDSTEEALFIAKLSYPFCTLSPPLRNDLPKAYSDNISVYPNPAYEECTITTSSTNPKLSRIEIIDLAGRLIVSYQLSGNSTTINVRDLTEGIYLCRIYTGDNTVTTKKMIVTK